MIRKPLPHRTSPAMAPALRRLLGAAPAALLLGCLLAAGCGQDDQHVPEWYPSGARPAPVPKVDAAAERAKPAPPPPGEIEAEPQPPPARPGATAARGGAGATGQASSGHLRLGGSYQADTGAAVTCSVLAGRGLEITFDAVGVPFVEVLVADVPGTGDYIGEVKLRARDAPRTVRASAGGARVHLDIATIERPRLGSRLGGTFTGAWAGPGVKGEIAGSFEGCVYYGAEL